MCKNGNIPFTEYNSIDSLQFLPVPHFPLRNTWFWQVPKGELEFPIINGQTPDSDRLGPV